MILNTAINLAVAPTHTPIDSALAPHITVVMSYTYRELLTNSFATPTP